MSNKIREESNRKVHSAARKTHGQGGGPFRLVYRRSPWLGGAFGWSPHSCASPVLRTWRRARHDLGEWSLGQKLPHPFQFAEQLGRRRHHPVQQEAHHH